MSLLPSFPQVALLILLSGWAAADTTAAFQFMIGQPMAAGLLTGAILGEPLTGLFMGVALQLLWSRLAPVGAAAYPDVGPATVCGVSVALLLPARLVGSDPSFGFRTLPASVDGFFRTGGPAGLSILLGLLVALATGRLGQVITVLLRRDNARLARAADAAAERGSFAGVERQNGYGVLRSFARGAAIFWFTITVSMTLASLALAAHWGARHKAVPDNPFLLAFWWFGLACLVSVLWRGGRRDWGVLAAGAAAGLLLRSLL